MLEEWKFSQELQRTVGTQPSPMPPGPNTSHRVRWKGPAPGKQNAI